ncbi:MAG TPA: hypothetical protein GX500_06860 [Firmicutes bacterium]|nr:hypothetical protein [Candidatus Fermentithermobacillaceae bacterium]
MGTTARSTRYRWKEGKEADLRDFVEGRVLEGVSITQALKEYAEKNRISWLTARWKYYQVRNRGAKKDVSKAEGESPRSVEPQTREESFFDYLQDLVRSTEESGQDIVPFIKGLSRMAVLSKESTRLREEIGALKRKLREIARVVEGHAANIEKWLQRSEVDRVSSLKEFSALMEEDLRSLRSARDSLEEI